MRRILATVLALAIMGTGVVAQARRTDDAGGGYPISPGSSVPRGTRVMTAAEAQNAARAEQAIKLENAKLQQQLLREQIKNTQLQSANMQVDMVIKIVGSVSAGAALGAAVYGYMSNE